MLLLKRFTPSGYHEGKSTIAEICRNCFRLANGMRPGVSEIRCCHNIWTKLRIAMEGELLNY